MSSWWSRKGGSKHSTTTSIQTNVSPVPSARSPSSRTPSSISPYSSTSPYSNHSPWSAPTTSTSTNGYLDPSYQAAPAYRKDSTPVRLLHTSHSYESRLDTLPASRPAHDHHTRPKTAHPNSTNSHLTLAQFLGLNDRPQGKSKHHGRPETHSTPTYMDQETIDICAEPDPPRIDTSNVAPISRNRAYTLSSSASTASGLLPITPGGSIGDDNSLLIVGARSRSNSASSQPSFLSRRAKQPPSLRAVEEYDPFAAGNTSSFYVQATPPALTPDSQYFEVPEPRGARVRATSHGYREKSDHPKVQLAGTLRIPPRPTATPESRTSATSPLSAGASLNAKKQSPLLPFRSKPGRDKGRQPEEQDKSEGSALLGGLLRPNNPNRTSSHSSSSTPSDSQHDTSQRQRLTSMPNRSPSRLPVSLANSPRYNDTHRLSSNSFNGNPLPPDAQSNPASSEVSSSKTRVSNATSTTSPAQSPAQPGSAGRPSRPLSTGSKGSVDSRQRRLRAALAVTVQDLDDPRCTKRSSLELDVNIHLGPADDHTRNGSGRGSMPRISPVVDDEGAFEFLLPPKNQIRLNGAPKDSPHYAPSFIVESVSSPGDHFYASPYPSGVTTVPLFRESDEWKRESQVDVRGAEIAAQDKSAGGLSVAPQSDEPPITPNLSSFPPVPDLMHDLNMAITLAEKLGAVQDEAPPVEAPVANSKRPSPLNTPPIATEKRGVASSSSPALPSPPPTAMTVQPIPIRDRISGLVNIAPLKIPEKPTTARGLSPAATVPPSASASSPVSPVNFRPNPIMKNVEAALSSLSFSSMSSRGGGASKGTGPRSTDDVDSDVEGPDVRLRSANRKRRGSEPSSLRSPRILEELPLGSSFGASAAMPSSTPPSAFAPRTRKWSRDNSRDGPTSPSVTRTTRSASTSTTASPVSRNPLASLIQNFAASTTSVNEESGPSSTPNPLPPPPKRRGSFNHIPLPPMPSLRHFNPSADAPVASGQAPRPLHTSTSSSNLSLASSGRTEVPSNHPNRRPSSSSKRRLLTRQTSKTSMNANNGTTSRTPADPIAEDVAVGPKGETMNYDFDWKKERARFLRDDDSQSLMTLNRSPSGNLPESQSSSVDGHYSQEVFSSSTSEVASAAVSIRSMGRTVRSRSPSRTDFVPMHIVPPSELLKLGDAAPEEDYLLDAGLRPLNDQDDLLHGDFEDMGHSLRDPEGASWLSELGVNPMNVSPYSSRTVSMMPVYKGREPTIPFVPGLVPPPSTRSLPRPSTGTRRDSAQSKASLGLNPAKRPSTSQASVTSAPSSRTVVGGPLSPPPPRSRLPRTSISSSMRSVPTTIVPSGHNIPLAPPPSRSRANSSSGLSGTTVRTERTVARRGTEVPPHVPPDMKKVQLPPLPSPKPLPKTSLKMKRQTLKPSFLDIDFEDEASEDSHSPPPLPRKAVELVDDSFLDMTRGASIDSTRNY